MGQARQRSLAMAHELAGAYPSTPFLKNGIEAYAKAFNDMGLDIADDVSSLARVRCAFAPSVATLYEIAREVRKEPGNKIDSKFDFRLCEFGDMTCRNCGEVHGRQLSEDEILHGLYHMKRWTAGDPEEKAAAIKPWECSCPGRGGWVDLDPIHA